MSVAEQRKATRLLHAALRAQPNNVTALMNRALLDRMLLMLLSHDSAMVVSSAMVRLERVPCRDVSSHLVLRS